MVADLFQSPQKQVSPDPNINKDANEPRGAKFASSKLRATEHSCFFSDPFGIECGHDDSATRESASEPASILGPGQHQSIRAPAALALGPLAACTRTHHQHWREPLCNCCNYPNRGLVGRYLNLLILCLR